jgi:protoporphyrinogen/coproporphyrinogen III oxidase
MTQPSAKRIAVIGGGISGVTATWQLAQHDRQYGGLDVTLYEASPRLGGTVETVLRDGFVIDCGPDGWVTEKPWARELARELGLQEKLVASNDATRVTYIVRDGKLVPLPDGMRMMVPTNLAALADSPLFTPAAIAAYAAEPARAAELKASAPNHDESIATFVRRHFGDEVLTKVAAPLLSGVFGGDVATLSVRAVMPAFVRMERELGSLILALQSAQQLSADPCAIDEKPSIFTSLDGGTQALIDRMVAEIPPNWIQLNSPITQIHRVPYSSQPQRDEWVVGDQRFDAIILATPAHITASLCAGILGPRAAELHRMEATSAVIAAFAFTQSFDLPPGFGFLVPAGESSRLLAGTFVDQKFPGRVPEGGRALRAFFGGSRAPAIAACSDPQIAVLALAELTRLLGTLPEPAFHIIRRWPRSLPQYAVGHLERMAELDDLLRPHPTLRLIGNTYRGVGLPDLIREARGAARDIIAEGGW